MKILMRAILLPAALTVLLLTPNMVAAQDSPSDPLVIYREAGANKQQQDKIRALADDFERAAKPKADELNKLSKKLRDVFLDPMPDEELATATQERIAELQQDIAMQQLRLRLTIRKVLSEPQRQRLVKLIKERAAAARPTMH